MAASSKRYKRDHHLTEDFYFNRHVILNCNTCVCKEIISFCSTGKASLDINNIEEITNTAKVWEMDELIELCENYMKDTLNHGNCLKYLRIAHFNTIDSVREVVLQFVIDEIQELCGLRGAEVFQNIKRDHIIKFTKHIKNNNDFPINLLKKSIKSFYERKYHILIYKIRECLN